MNPKRTWVLVGLAAGLFAFIYFFESRRQEPKPPPPLVLPGLKPGAVTSVEVHTGVYKIRAERANGVWQLVEPVPYAAQPGAIENFLKGVEELSYQTRISAEELRDRPRASEDFGFNSPMGTLLIQQAGDAQPRQIKLGKLTPPGNEVYVQVVGAENVDVVSTEFFKCLPAGANAWRDTSLISPKNLAFDHLIITNSGKVLELQKESNGAPWRMTRPLQVRADSDRIDQLLYQLQNLHVSRFESDDAKVDLESMGLQPAAWELALGQGTNMLLSFKFGKSPTNAEDQVYARRNGRDTIMLVPREPLEPWRADHEKFRDPHLAGLTTGVIDQIEVSGGPGQETFTLQRQTNDAWQIVSQTRNVTMPADSGRARGFIDALAKLEIASSPGQFAVKEAVTDSDFPKYGLATPARKYLLKRTQPNPAGGVTNQLLVELDFGSKEEDKIFARRLPDECSVYSVRFGDFERLPATSLALRERRIWRFTEDEVTRLAIEQDGQVQQLQHAGTNKWIVALDSQKVIYDSFQVEEAAGELGELEAQNWVDCGATNRAQYGFSDKSTKITVDLAAGGRTATVALELGGVSPKSKLRYGSVRLDGQDWIFEVPPKLMQRLAYYLKLRDNISPP